MNRHAVEMPVRASEEPDLRQTHETIVSRIALNWIPHALLIGQYLEPHETHVLCLNGEPLRRRIRAGPRELERAEFSLKGAWLASRRAENPKLANATG